jgi:hypothetical protein
MTRRLLKDMKVREFFDKAVQVGIDNDPRGKEIVLRVLEDRNKDFNKIEEKEKEYYDEGLLTNPYPDTKILYATGEEDIRGAIVGIDMEAPEVAITHALRERGEPIDLIIAHHPEGAAYAKLHEVMAMQADILGRFGVPINMAEALLEKRIADVERRLLPANHSRAVDAAKLLNIPMINLHTPSDNMVATYLQNRFDKEAPRTLGDILDMLLEEPEYKDAKREGAGPKIIIGSEKRQTGKVFVDMTGGTEGAKEIFKGMLQCGINTVVGMHFSDDHKKEAEKNHLNLVIAGHISSDNVGLNLLFDQVSGKDGVKFYEASGFRRFSRVA